MIITSFDVAIVDGDTHISEWVKKHERLDIATWMISKVQRYIRPGSLVIDGGANIGDHMMTYSHLVGKHGRVFGFECNSEAHACLEYNTKHMLENWLISDLALWSKHGKELRFVTDPNVGASHVTTNLSDHKVRTTTIDYVCAQLNQSETGEPRTVSLIKLDIEGAEMEALHGAAETIEKYRPVLLLEVNEWALNRLGHTGKELLEYVSGLGYGVQMVDDSCTLTDPQFDIICVPEFEGASAWQNSKKLT